MQKSDFLTNLIGFARAKVLRLFILYEKEVFDLKELAQRASVSPRVAQSEVALLTKLGIVREELGEGKSERARKLNARWSLDPTFKHASALSAFVHEVSPAEFRDVEKALRGSGRLTAIVLSGIFTGDLNRPVDLIVVGDYVNEKRLEKAARSFEPKYGREIRYAIFSTPEFRYRLTIHDKLIRDTLDYPHRVLLNKHNLI
jgi:hypothetical protein